jgi:hypothetical protein
MRSDSDYPALYSASGGFIPPSYCPITVPVRRDRVRPGVVVQSSHGYRLLITEVRDTAQLRTDDRTVELRGHLHVDLANTVTNERYPAGSTIPVERPSTLYQVTLGINRPDCAMTCRYDYLAAMNEDEAVAQAKVAAAHEFSVGGWELEAVELVA